MVANKNGKQIIVYRTNFLSLALSTYPYIKDVILCHYIKIEIPNSHSFLQLLSPNSKLFRQLSYNVEYSWRGAWGIAVYLLFNLLSFP